MDNGGAHKSKNIKECVSITYEPKKSTLRRKLKEYID